MNPTDYKQAQQREALGQMRERPRFWTLATLAYFPNPGGYPILTLLDHRAFDSFEKGKAAFEAWDQSYEVLRVRRDFPSANLTANFGSLEVA